MLAACLLLLLALTSSSSGQQGPSDVPRTAEDDNFGIPGFLSMKGVTMNVVEAPTMPSDYKDQLQELERAIIDGSKINSSQLNEAIVNLIAAEMKNAGMTADDVRDFITNSIDNDTELNTDAPVDDRTDATSNSDEEHEVQTNSEDMQRGDDEKDDQMGAPRNAHVLRSAKPSDGTPDVFRNGTNFFKWLDEILKEVADRMSTGGDTADPIAQSERPPGMDSQTFRDRGDSKQSFDSQQFNEPRNSYAINNKYKTGSDKSFDSVGNTWNTSPSSQPQQMKSHLLSAPFGPHPPNGFDGWKDSEKKNGGFDAIPKAVPMIVMSGNTYIKDIGNFRNNYSYNGNVYGNPASVRTVEPNGNDSGVDVDASTTANNKEEIRKHLLTAKRDGDVRPLLRMLARIHGHDDGEKGDHESRHDDGGRRWDPRFDDESTRHDDSRHWDPRFDDESSRHDDGNTYHSAVHGHDDGDSRTLLRSSASSTKNSHGHDDGNTYNPTVHGHDDFGNRNGGGSDNTHGHDDGNTYNPSVHGPDDSGSTNGGGNDNTHGHDDGNTYNPAVHEYDDFRSRNSGGSDNTHGHDDGNTYNPSVHGRDDSGSTNGRGSDNSHGHDDGNTYNPSVHGRDDSGSRSGGGSDNSHGHDDGNTYNPSVHGHDDSGPSIARGGILRDYWHHDDGVTHKKRHDDRATYEKHHDDKATYEKRHDDGATHEKHDDGRSLLRAAKPASMSMIGISLTAIGSVMAGVLLVAIVVVARRRRAGIFRRADYVEV